MNLLQHIRYFNYIAAEWGVRLGLFTFYHELRGEKKYQLNTTSFNDLAYYNITGNELPHATFYMPVSYFTMEQLLSHIPEKAKAGSFLDIGCGKGRAMCVAAHFGYKKVTGLDFARELIDAAEKNLQHTKQKYPALEYELFWKDISMLEINKTVSTLFLFNPFDEVLMKTVIEKIARSLAQHPRPLYILYATPKHEELFFAAGFDVLYRIKKFHYLEGVILTINTSLVS